MDSKALAAYLGYTQQAIYKLVKEGLLAIRVRGHFRFKKDLVDKWQEERMYTGQQANDEKNNTTARETGGLLPEAYLP
jgi:excisionase family DNA binding protein